MTDARHGKARRKIDLSQLSPNSRKTSAGLPDEEDADAIYEQLRIQSFNATWSKIECTIQVSHFSSLSPSLSRLFRISCVLILLALISADLILPLSFFSS